jgi:hypothetical protein
MFGRAPALAPSVERLFRLRLLWLEKRLAKRLLVDVENG